MNDSTQKRHWGFRWRGAVGIPFLGPAQALTILSTPAIVEGTWLDLAADFVARVAFYGGLPFCQWPTLYVGGRKLHVLVTDGPNSIYRNPLYFKSFLITISCGLFLKVLTFAAAFGLAILGCMWATLPAEKKRPREEHDAPDDEYCRNVPRCWPRSRTPESIEVNVSGRRIELKRALVWTWLPFIGELVAHLRAEAWWPHVLHRP